MQCLHCGQIIKEKDITEKKPFENIVIYVCPKCGQVGTCSYVYYCDPEDIR